MIIVETYRCGVEIALRMSGHALFKPGNDIVCSAVSVLGETLEERFSELEAEGKLSVLTIKPPASGELYVYARSLFTTRDEVMESYDTVMTGLRMVAEAYPKHVEIRPMPEGWENNPSDS